MSSPAPAVVPELDVFDLERSLAFYVGKLGFTLVEDTYQPAQDKRWVLIAPPGDAGGTTLLLAAIGTALLAVSLRVKRRGRR